MKIIKKLTAAMTAISFVFASLPSNVYAADADNKEQVLFKGSSHSDFKQWGDDWNAAVELGTSDFSVDDFTTPFTLKVEYESSAEPILVMLSWSGGPAWVQMTPTYASNGVAYYKYDLISTEYGTDFSKLDGIKIMPSPSDDGLTVSKVSYVYESDESDDIEISYDGLSGDIINSINAGWNLGNTLDSYGDWITQYTDAGTDDFETSWGNPVTTKAMIDAVKSAGFNAVRVPVTWSQHIDDSNGYKIDEEWMARVKEVVDYVMDNDMYCILNVHHDVGGSSWLKASESNINSNKEKFESLWTQIADEFEGYSNKLMFEGFNEILDEDNNWVYPGKSAGDAVNTLNQIFVDTVRKTGGNNAERCLIVNTYAAGTGSSQLDDFVVPTDTAENALMVEVHYYSPGSYCTEISSDGNDQKVWTENGGKSTADGTLYNLYEHFTSKGIPVIIGEFGAANKDNESDRAEWAGYLVENAKKYGMKCFWWDGGGKIESDSEYGYYKGMSIYNRYDNTWVFPEIVTALTGKNPSETTDTTGDVNGDGVVNIADVVLLQHWILKISDTQTINYKNSDLNNDNKINVIDLCTLKEKATA